MEIVETVGSIGVNDAHLANTTRQRLYSVECILVTLRVWLAKVFNLATEK